MVQKELVWYLIVIIELYIKWIIFNERVTVAGI